MQGVVGKAERLYDPVSKEAEILEWWDKNEIYEKVKNLRRGGLKFYFLDGPPYVTNPPHVGTAWNKFLKDVIIRYRRMRGFDVRDQPGYDCHGLPIEVKVEESLGLKSKKDIEDKIGVSEFISKCKSYAMENVEEQTRIFRDLGVWMDWADPYLTLRDGYMEAVWWTIKRAHEKNLLEKGLRVVHWCPRCETALAGYEVTDEYRDVEDHSIYVKMPVKGEAGTHILIWTTTPWTLPSNVAVMVHPDEEYVEAEAQGERYILAKVRCEPVFRGMGIPYKVVRSFRGRELEGLEYEPPLIDEVPLQRELKNAHKIVLSREYVSMGEGTGCVHSAPGHGEEDFEVGLEYGLPVVSPVDERGRFTEAAGKYSGRYVKDADREIIEDLKSKNLLLHHTKVVHSYPHCWRCKTPLIMRAAEQWFIKVTAFKERLLEENMKVTWVPEWAGSKRFADWLRGARDWVISRQRYWGVPLPIWICNECGSARVIGSIGELEASSVNHPPVTDLHRDCVDGIRLRCKCGGIMDRVPDIVDVWMDSGVASWASLEYPKEDAKFNEWWPADAVTEAHDQTRGWFYTQLITSIICFDGAPYKAVIMHGHTLDPRGQKMSKSLGNFISPHDVTSKYGRDALRLYELQSTIWEDFRFSIEKVEDAYRDLQIAWNVLSFASIYMNLDGFKPEDWPIEGLLEHMRVEDRWLLSRIERLKADVTKAMEGYEIHEAARLIRDFIVEDLSHWYIRLVRRRFWLEKESPEKLAAYKALFHALRDWISIAAPFIPFLTEAAYRSIISPAVREPPESIHMVGWPEAHLEWIDDDLEEEMAIARKVVSAVMSARQSLKLKLRQPVRELIVFTEDSKARRAIHKLIDVILEAANAKSLRCPDVKDEEAIKRVRAIPNFRSLGPLFKDKAARIGEAIKGSDGTRVLKSIREGGFYELEVEGERIRITPEMISLIEEMPEGFARGEFDGGRVYVDSRLTDDLRREGLARDVVRRIQEMRRIMDLPVDAFIDLYIIVPGEEECEWLREYTPYIAEEVRAREVTLTQEPQGRREGYFEKEWTIDGKAFHIGIRRR
ncbi:MAG: isoleucine--tRNA ligase [Candidatus Bathyarchaeia archaeon]